MSTRTSTSLENSYSPASTYTSEQSTASKSAVSVRPHATENVAAIAGPVLGVVVLLFAAVVVILWRKKLHHSKGTRQESLATGGGDSNSMPHPTSVRLPSEAERLEPTTNEKGVRYEDSRFNPGQQTENVQVRSTTFSLGSPSSGDEDENEDWGAQSTVMTNDPRAQHTGSAPPAPDESDQVQLEGEVNVLRQLLLIKDDQLDRMGWRWGTESLPDYNTETSASGSSDVR